MKEIVYISNQDACMSSLSFSLSPSALTRLHDVLICLSKFEEYVSLEATKDLVK